MNTRQYCYLSTIAESGSLSHAAQALGLSPSALSKFLTECERTFGTALSADEWRELLSGEYNGVSYFFSRELRGESHERGCSSCNPSL